MKKLFGIICAILFLVSCSNEDGSQNLSGNKEIRFSSKLSLLKSTYQSTQIANGQKVGVFIAENVATPTVTYTQNLSYTGDGQGNLSGSTLYFPDNGNSLKISAYHPYNDGSEDAYLFSVASDQTDASSIYASDLLFCPAFVQAPTDGQIILTFKHMLSQVNVSLTAGNGSPDLTDAQVSIVNAATAIEFNRKDGSLGAASGIQEVKLDGDLGITVPQTVNSGTKFIKIVLSSGKELFYTLSQNLTLESSKKYTFNLVVNLTDVASIGTDVDDWETGETINGGASEDLADKLLPSTLTEKGGQNENNIIKTVFRYDVLNRVEIAERYWSNSNSAPKYTEYVFKYNDSDSKIMGWTSKEYTGYLNSTNFDLREHANVDLTYGQGNVTIAYEDSFIDNEGNDEVYQTGTEIVNFDENGNSYLESTVSVVYDDKNSPFINLNIQGWLRDYLFKDDYWTPFRESLLSLAYLGTHNVVETYKNGMLYHQYTLTYNDKDYMTVRKWESGNLSYELSVEYTGWK
ncbi:fimbrillin family protein [Dysgonomonas sp. 521]|uniref:fimbrillin family protein n=1 Tax=Dysgonomonas sp. 521 TaxID=2302932 RepID=UPI0013D71930|nr:fimbrillin family protein [Dysgonomonas sp. 521]NDV95519.1 fimbrillin family protein [Dysgonomonas sp. 521]